VFQISLLFAIILIANLPNLVPYVEIRFFPAHRSLR
jgi:hypothetical protein